MSAYRPEPHVPEPDEITGDEEVNGPLHPAADAEYLSAAANWLGLAEENTQTWQDFRVPAQDRTDARMTVTVFARLAELNIAMASACGGYQYRQRMNAPPVDEALANLKRLVGEPVPNPSATEVPCECCAAGLMSLRPGEEKCAECGHGFVAHAAGDTAPTPPEAACDQFVAPQPEAIAADHLCERCGASAAAHVRSIAQVQGGIPGQHAPYPLWPKVGPLAGEPSSDTHIRCPECGFTGRALADGERDRRTPENDPWCPRCVTRELEDEPPALGPFPLHEFENRNGTTLADLDVDELTRLGNKVRAMLADNGVAWP